jgi:hypothetical protein
VKFAVLESEFETRVNELVRETEEQERLGTPVVYKWKLNETPDEPVGQLRRTCKVNKPVPK